MVEYFQIWGMPLLIFLVSGFCLGLAAQDHQKKHYFRFGIMFVWGLLLFLEGVAQLVLNLWAAK